MLQIFAIIDDTSVMNFRKKLQHNFPKMTGGRGVKGRLELFRKFIRFGRGIRPLPKKYNNQSCNLLVLHCFWPNHLRLTLTMWECLWATFCLVRDVALRSLRWTFLVGPMRTILQLDCGGVSEWKWINYCLFPWWNFNITLKFVKRVDQRKNNS